MGFGTAAPGDEIAWTLLTLGHLSANKFWGETERVRAPLCTSTLIRTSAGLLLVDPALDPARMFALLHEAAGVRSEDIRYVFITHSHADHRCGLEAFPAATWLMAEAEIAFWRARATHDDYHLFERLTPADAVRLPGLRPLLTPGHTPGTTSLIFDWRGQRVAVTGDAVMTQDHFRAREGHTNSIDVDLARASIARLSLEADVIVPGHDNAFVVAWANAGAD